jgi:hypothetical protein
MKLMFTHVETSGLGPERGEILELTYQPWADGVRGPISNDIFRAVGNMNAKSFVEAAGMNGYDDEKRINCATLRAGFLVRFFEGLDTGGDNTLIACNPTLTRDYIVTTAKRFGLTVPAFRVYDVASIALPLLVAEKVKSLKLRDLCELVGKPGPKSSIEKVERTIDVFEECFRRYYGALVGAS